MRDADVTEEYCQYKAPEPLVNLGECIDDAKFLRDTLLAPKVGDDLVQKLAWQVPE